MSDEINKDTVDYRDPTPFDDTKLNSITEISKGIRHKMNGKDTREAIAQQGEALVKLMQETGGNQSAEVIAARGDHELLSMREDAQDNAIIAAQSTANSKFGKADGESYLKSITVVPETFANLAEIQAKYPSGKNGLMVAADNGHKYIWANGTWTDAGVYQSVGIGDKTVITSKLADSSVIPLKTNFISKNPKNINLFDKNSEDNLIGKIVTHEGVIGYYSGWSFSHSIPCKPGDTFIVGTTSAKGYGYAALFNGDQWISIVDSAAGYWKVPTDVTADSIRFGIETSLFESTMIVLMPNKLPNEYIPFNFLLDSQIKVDYANLENVSVGENGVTLLNPISGKTVSIVGDSYSAFTGWVPEGSAINYNGTYNGVTSVTNMWWYKVIKKFNMSLMLNESWSGSTICNTGYNASDATSTSFLTRITKRYGATNTLGQKPQVLFVLGGLNDTWAKSPLGNAKYSDWTTDDLKTVLGAYSKMINEILLYNPGIEIINFEYAGVSQAIRDGKALICEHFGVKNVPISVVDSLSGHPTTTGMQQIVDQITTALNV